MTSQNPEYEWRREAPPLIFWVLCPKQNLHSYLEQKGGAKRPLFSYF
jgi:hypothetical protein